VSDINDLVAHIDQFDGTLVRPGTPVEKHWYEYIEYPNFSQDTFNAVLIRLVAWIRSSLLVKIQWQ
jgi:hypothetical protein